MILYIFPYIFQGTEDTRDHRGEVHAHTQQLLGPQRCHPRLENPYELWEKHRKIQEKIGKSLINGGRSWEKSTLNGRFTSKPCLTAGGYMAFIPKNFEGYGLGFVCSNVSFKMKRGFLDDCFFKDLLLYMVFLFFWGRL